MRIFPLVWIDARDFPGRLVYQLLGKLVRVRGALT
jgi:hypothetical protein